MHWINTLVLGVIMLDALIVVACGTYIAFLMLTNRKPDDDLVTRIIGACAAFVVSNVVAGVILVTGRWLIS